MHWIQFWWPFFCGGESSIELSFHLRTIRVCVCARVCLHRKCYHFATNRKLKSKYLHIYLWMRCEFRTQSIAFSPFTSFGRCKYHRLGKCFIFEYFKPPTILARWILISSRYLFMVFKVVCISHCVNVCVHACFILRPVWVCVLSGCHWSKVFAYYLFKKRQKKTQCMLCRQMNVTHSVRYNSDWHEKNAGA